MSFSDSLSLALIYLAAMVLSVPLAKRFGLGMVLGYLIAGTVLGPSVLGILQSHNEGVTHLSEFGVIMMLFLIGLELKPTVLWKLRGPIFGLGGIQVLLSTLILMFVGIFSGWSWQVGLAGGMILSLSSTAIVLQTLQEKGAIKTTGGETAFSVLLFQDMAVIPMLAIFPALSIGKTIEHATSASMDVGSAWLQGAKTLGAVILVIVIGRYLIRPVFKIVGLARLRELFTAMALLLVLAITLLMNSVGLSPALGAFLAGVVLADSEYRHQLETDIEPFKGLLLGVFFISVGAGIDFAQVKTEPGLIMGLVMSILAVKWTVLFAVGKLGKLPMPDRLLFAFSLAQGGEFAFVLLSNAQQEGIFSSVLVQSITAAVAISMFIAPFMIQGHLKWIQPRFATPKRERPSDKIDEHDNPVIVAGFGRFGQMATRLLKASGFQATVLDFDAEQIDVIRRFGSKAFYGDASQMDLLKSAGAQNAKLLILAIDDAAKALEIIDSVKVTFPHLKILARAYDRIQAYEMIHRGIESPYIETAGSALNLTVDALKYLGVPAEKAFHAGQVFNRFNNKSIQELAKVYHEADEATFVSHARNWLTALEGVLQTDAVSVPTDGVRGWEAAPTPSIPNQ